MTEPDAAPDYMLDELAERQVLGIVLAAPAMAEATFAKLNALPSWTNERRDIAAAIAELYGSGEPVDVSTVQQGVVARAGTDDRARRGGMAVFELYQQVTAATPDVLTYWADRVHHLARGRTATDAATLLRQRIDQALRNDDTVGYDRALLDAAAAIEDAQTPLDAAVVPPMSHAELLDVPTTFDWIIPGLMERMDRLIFTGFEGLGKSELLAQVALCSAAGLHPFTGRPLAIGGGRPITVLVVDTENAERQMARRYGRIGRLVEALCDEHGIDRPDWAGGCLRYVIRPDGIPLSDPRELARLEQSIAATVPELVVAGPHYKLADADTRDEQEAKTVTVMLDRLRARHRFALILEAHAGHGNGTGQRELRPTGSSLFRRWPEFGYGIRAAPGHEDERHPTTVTFEPWRGDRETRAWPRALSHMRSLPWMSYGPYEDQMDTLELAGAVA